MIDAFARGLGVYSLQVGLVTLAGAAAARFVPLPTPAARSAYWRAVVLLCLLLPLWPARIVDVTVHRVAAPSLVQAEMTSLDAPLPAAAPVVRSVPLASRFVWILPLVLVGIFVRLVWLAIGVVSLRRITRTAGDTVDAADLLTLCRDISPTAEVRWHSAIEQPATFGFRRPIVLLPDSLREQTIDVQRAVLCHELLHASRADWVAALVEQVIESCFWFHPAIWWSVSQLELCREQVVDGLTVTVTGSRRTYLEALLLFADGRSAGRAAAFGGRRQFSARIKQLSEESVMSRRRYTLSAVALAAMMLTSVWAFATELPLRTERRFVALPEISREPARGLVPGAMPVAGVASTPVAVQPSQAAARPAAAPEPDARTSELRRRSAAVAQLMRQLQATVAQQTGTPGVIVTPTPAPRPAASGGSALAELVTNPTPKYPDIAVRYGVGATVALTATVTPDGSLAGIAVARWNLTIDRDIEDANYFATSPQKEFIDESIAGLQRWSVKPQTQAAQLKVTFTFTPTVRIVAAHVELQAADGSPARTASFGGGTGPSFSSGEPVRVGNGVSIPRQVTHEPPVYPQVARDGRVGGIVIIQVTIGANGTVTDTKILKSVPLLDQAALDAVRQWQYEPTIVNGVAVPVTMAVTVNFSLR